MALSGDDIGEASTNFINEFIPADDIEKYGIRAIDIYYIRITFKPHWTIDRARDVYLRQVAVGREEFAQDRTFTLYWKGTLIEVRLQENGGVGPAGDHWSDFKLTDLKIVPDLLNQRHEILMDLKAALTAYNGGGVYSSGGTYNTTCQF